MTQIIMQVVPLPQGLPVLLSFANPTVVAKTCKAIKNNNKASCRHLLDLSEHNEPFHLLFKLHLPQVYKCLL